MKTRYLIALTCLLSISFGRVAAAGDGWSLSKLVPFKKAPSDPRAKGRVSDETPSYKLPRIRMPDWSTPASKPPQRSKPSTISKLSDGTKDIFGKTKNVLMPWGNSAKKPRASQPSRRKASTSSWLTSWIPKKKKKEQKEIRTVNEFLSLDRPEF